MRKEWRIREALHDILIVRGFEATSEERQQSLAPWAAAHKIFDWFGPQGYGETHPRSMLLQIWQELGMGPRHAARISNPDLVAAVMRSFQSGQLVAIRRPLPTGYGIGVKPGQPGLEAPPEEAPPPDETSLDWIEIELIDDADQPVPNEPFLVELADGSKRSGSLDQQGFRRLDNIPPGTCTVTFPGFDGREWGPA